MKISIICILMSIIQTTAAEVVLDGSLGKSGNLSGPNYDITAELGSQVGSNLFHSFQSLNLNSDETATFSGDTSIHNVIGRVTGGAPSLINGTLRNSIPNADLYLVNPAGLIFGATAKLDVSGSFHASTADVINLNDGGKLSVHLAQESLLTTASPVSFGFLNNTGAEIQLNGTQFKVPTGKNFTLAAGKINLQYNSTAKQIAAISALGGDIRLAGVAQGELRFDNGLQLNGQASDVIIRNSQLNNSYDKSGNVYIRAGHFVLDNSAIAALTFSKTGGVLDIQGDEVEISGGSQISSSSLKTGDSGAIHIQATQSITLSGKESRGVGVAIAANTRGTEAQAGRAGDITLQAPRIALYDGAKLGSASYGTGNGGTVTLNATDSVILDGEDNSTTNSTTSSIYLVATGSGQGGTLNIQTNELQLRHGASIAADTKGSGQGGNVAIRANTIQLSGISAKNSTSSILSNTNGTASDAGNGGTLDIQTQQLTVQDGGQISSSTFNSGSGGQINIVAAERFVLQGSNGNFSSGIYSVAKNSGQAGFISIAAGIATLQDGAQINAGTYEQGSGGAIFLQAQHLSLSNRSKITAFSQGSGDAGSLAIQLADRLDMTDAAIETKTNQADGGNIFISSPNYLYLQNSSITTSVEAQNGNGGNIALKPNFLVLDNTPVIARAISGNGGNISITTKGIYRFAPQTASPIDASSQYGLDGVVTIASPDGETDEGFLTLPSNFNSAQALLKSLCTLEHFENLSSLVVKPSNYPNSPEDYQSSMQVH